MKKVSQVLGFAPKKSETKLPKIVEQPVTPLPDTDAIDLTAKKSEAMRRKTGRSSTLLTDDDTVG